MRRPELGQSLFLLTLLACASALAGQFLPQLGEAPGAPQNPAELPRGGPAKDSVTGSFSVNPASREQARSFFNAAYGASEGVTMGSTAQMAGCFPGTNAPAYYDAVLLRLNWYRAMAGVPAVEIFNLTNCEHAQAAALMMSANTNLNHFPPPTWSCFTANGANAASNCNLALGFAGPSAVDSFMMDFGTPNYPCGHRRWVLYPQTKVMGTGDVPVQPDYMEANATWVLDGNFGGPRPATRTPYVCWPPPGYAPYPVVFPRWSFAYPNANFSAATVTMTSNGVPISVSLETYDPNSYGENTLVWVPMGLDAGNFGTLWPFSGTDTVYTVAISNVANASASSYRYSVTVFDPATTGTDYSPCVIHGTNKLLIGQTNNYTFTPTTNATSYQWQASAAISASFFDGAENGFGQIVPSVSPGYSAITNTVTAAGAEAYHLAMTAGEDQILTINEVFLPGSNSVLNFSSLFGLATVSQIARAQASTDGIGWFDLFTRAGDGTWGQLAFTNESISLAGLAGYSVRLRFNYSFEPGDYFTDVDSPYPGYYDGWYIDNIAVTNCGILTNSATYNLATTNFTFGAPTPGNYALLARPVAFNGFPLEWGSVTLVSVAAPPPIVISLGQAAISSSNIDLSFSLDSGDATNFHLLSAANLDGPWVTNAAAILTTNAPGASYRFRATLDGPTQFYRVQSP